MSNTTPPVRDSAPTITTQLDEKIAAADNRAVAQAPAWRRLLLGGATWVLLLDLVLIAFFSVLNPVFFSIANFQNILLNGSEGLLLALAMAMLLSAGLIDLSLGANLVFSSLIGANVMVLVAGGSVSGLGGSTGDGTFQNVPFAIVCGLVAAVLAGVVFGLVNGLVIAYLRVNSLIATLGTMSVAMGVVLLLTGGSDVGGLPDGLQTGFGLYRIGNLIPLPAVISILVAVAIWAVMRYLKFGLYTLTIGSSRVSAERAGIRVNVHTLKLTAFAGALAGLAGFMNIAHFGSTTINGHVNDPLAAITAAVIGGAALTGGRVSIIGTVWGAALALILLGGLVVIGTSPYYQLIVTGSILVAAVAVDQFRNRKRERR